MILLLEVRVREREMCIRDSDTAVYAVDYGAEMPVVWLQGQLTIEEAKKWRVSIVARNSCVVFSRCRKHPHRLYIGNTQIPRYHSMKYLRLHIHKHVT